MHCGKVDLCYSSVFDFFGTVIQSKTRMNWQRRKHSLPGSGKEPVLIRFTTSATPFLNYLNERKIAALQKVSCVTETTAFYVFTEMCLNECTSFKTTNPFLWNYKPLLMELQTPFYGTTNLNLNQYNVIHKKHLCMSKKVRIY